MAATSGWMLQLTETGISKCRPYRSKKSVRLRILPKKYFVNSRERTCKNPDESRWKRLKFQFMRCFVRICINLTLNRIGSFSGGCIPTATRDIFQRVVVWSDGPRDAVFVRYAAMLRNPVQRQRWLRMNYGSH